LNEEDLAGKGKGRDIGYALAARSLRGSQQRGSMHHHGPWCNHCFRSSKPQPPLAELSVFSGLATQQVTLPGWITQSTSNRLILLEPILSIVDSAKVKRLVGGCQCRFSVQTPNVIPHVYDGRTLFRVRALLRMKISTTMFYTGVSTMIFPDW